jgi:outer membrane protein assembly factor BamB
MAPVPHGPRRSWAMSGLFGLALSVAIVGGPTQANAPTATGLTGEGTTDAFTVSADWVQFHFSSDLRGVNPFEALLTPEKVDQLVLDWKAPAATGGYRSSPIIVDGVLYASEETPTGGAIRALDSMTGQPLWTRLVGPTPTTPAVTQGVLIVADLAGRLHALDPITGSRLWTRSVGNVYGDISVSSGVAFVETSSGDVWAINAMTGDVKWRFSRPEIDFTGTPAIEDGRVFVGGQPVAANGIVFSLDENSGDLLWRMQLPGQFQRIEASISVSDGRLYLGTTDGNPRSVVVCLGSRRGRIKWVYPLPESVDTGFGAAPAVADGTVYVPSTADSPVGNPELFALDADTGKLAWKASVSGSYSSPAVANGVVYVGGEAADAAQLSALDATTGEVLWAYRENGTAFPIQSSPAVVDGRVYVGTIVGTQAVLAFSLP